MAASAVLFLIACGLLFYIYLFAMRQTVDRQQAWFWSFIVWLTLEILLVSTFMVFVQHIIIPSLIMPDIRKVKRQVAADITSFKTMNKSQTMMARIRETLRPRSSLANVPEKKQVTSTFNAAKYFYVSWRLAKMYPSLPESGAVTHFSTPFPQKAIKQEAKVVSKVYGRRLTFIGQAASRVIVYLLVSVVNSPAVVQDGIVQVISSSGIGYAVLLMIKLFQVSPLLVLVPIVVIIILTHFYINSHKNVTLVDSLDGSSSLVVRRGQIVPVTSVHATRNTDRALKRADTPAISDGAPSRLNEDDAAISARDNMMDCIQSTPCTSRSGEFSRHTLVLQSTAQRLQKSTGTVPPNLMLPSQLLHEHYGDSNDEDSDHDYSEDDVALQESEREYCSDSDYHHSDAMTSIPTEVALDAVKHQGILAVSAAGRQPNVTPIAARSPEVEVWKQKFEALSAAALQTAESSSNAIEKLRRKCLEMEQLCKAEVCHDTTAAVCEPLLAAALPRVAQTFAVTVQRREVCTQWTNEFLGKCLHDVASRDGSRIVAKGTELRQYDPDVDEILSTPANTPAAKALQKKCIDKMEEMSATSQRNQCTMLSLQLKISALEATLNDAKKHTHAKEETPQKLSDSTVSIAPGKPKAFLTTNEIPAPSPILPLEQQSQPTPKNRDMLLTIEEHMADMEAQLAADKDVASLFHVGGVEHTNVSPTDSKGMTCVDDTMSKDTPSVLLPSVVPPVEEILALPATTRRSQELQKQCAARVEDVTTALSRNQEKIRRLHAQILHLEPGFVTAKSVTTISTDISADHQIEHNRQHDQMTQQKSAGTAMTSASQASQREPMPAAMQLLHASEVAGGDEKSQPAAKAMEVASRLKNDREKIRQLQSQIRELERGLVEDGLVADRKTSTDKATVSSKRRHRSRKKTEKTSSRLQVSTVDDAAVALTPVSTSTGASEITHTGAATPTTEHRPPLRPQEHIPLDDYDLEEISLAPPKKVSSERASKKSNRTSRKRFRATGREKAWDGCGADDEMAADCKISQAEQTIMTTPPHHTHTESKGSGDGYILAMQGAAPSGVDSKLSGEEMKAIVVATLHDRTGLQTGNDVVAFTPAGRDSEGAEEPLAFDGSGSVIRAFEDYNYDDYAVADFLFAEPSTFVHSQDNPVLTAATNEISDPSEEGGNVPSRSSAERQRPSGDSQGSSARAHRSPTRRPFLEFNFDNNDDW